MKKAFRKEVETAKLHFSRHDIEPICIQFSTSKQGALKVRCYDAASTLPIEVMEVMLKEKHRFKSIPERHTKLCNPCIFFLTIVV